MGKKRQTYKVTLGGTEWRIITEIPAFFFSFAKFEITFSGKKRVHGLIQGFRFLSPKVKRTRDKSFDFTFPSSIRCWEKGCLLDTRKSHARSTLIIVVATKLPFTFKNWLISTHSKGAHRQGYFPEIYFGNTDFENTFLLSCYTCHTYV